MGISYIGIKGSESKHSSFNFFIKHSEVLFWMESLATVYNLIYVTVTL